MKPRIEKLRAKITSKGRLTIPKEVREKLGVKAGDSLLFDVDDEGREAKVRVERKRVSFADYEGACRKGKGMNREELDQYMRDLRGYDDVHDAMLDEGKGMSLEEVNEYMRDLRGHEAEPDEGDISETRSEVRKHKHR